MQLAALRQIAAAIAVIFLKLRRTKGEMEESHEFPANYIKILIRTRLDMESEFQEGRKKKSFLWGRILEIIKEKVPEFNLSRDQISRKFVNLFCTYKRIKKRNSLTGRAASAWEFFEELDDVYGTRHSISTPPENLHSSLSLPSTRHASNVVEDIGVSNDSPGTSNNTTSTNLGRRRRTTSTNESLEFLKEEAKNEKERHDQIIELEREKMQIERERIQTMASLRDMLQKFLDR